MNAGKRFGSVLRALEQALEAKGRVVGTAAIEIIGSQQIGGFDAGVRVIEAAGDVLEALVAAIFLGFVQKRLGLGPKPEFVEFSSLGRHRFEQAIGLRPGADLVGFLDPVGRTAALPE